MNVFIFLSILTFFSNNEFIIKTGVKRTTAPAIHRKYFLYVNILSNVWET